ncbi:MAG: dihydroorotase [Verrucomicrobiota bacterium]
MDTIVLNSPVDMHLHLRDGAMLQAVAPETARQFAGAVVMPNLKPPVDSLDKLLAYRERIMAAVGDAAFEPFMTLFLRDYSEEELLAAREHIIGVKLYPEGVTTNSDTGLPNVEAAESTYARMEALGIPLLVHGETHGFSMDREREFVAVYDYLASKFPQLKIIMEHITTVEAAEFLGQHENVFATITLHHLSLTLDDLLGGSLQPHLFCKPIVKTPQDREAILKLALEAHPRVMFGSDSAPHPLSAKTGETCAAGVFSAPLLLPALAELFEQHGALDKLPAFVCDNARRIYDIQPAEKTVTLKKAPMTVPEMVGEVRPWRDGQTLNWSLAD